MNVIDHTTRAIDMDALAINEAKRIVQDLKPLMSVLRGLPENEQFCQLLGKFLIRDPEHAIMLLERYLPTLALNKARADANHEH